MQVTGRVGVDPLAADVRVITKNAELAPYQPYLPTTARVSGAADLDLAVAVPSLAERRATARGTATLSRVDVRERESHLWVGVPPFLEAVRQVLDDAPVELESGRARQRLDDLDHVLAIE